MIVDERGVVPPSEVFINSVNDFEKNALYYLFETGQYFCNENYHVEKYHYGYLLLHILKGKMSIRYKNKYYAAKQNDVIFLDLHQSHMYRADETLHFKYLLFDGCSTAKYFDFLNNKTGCIFSISNNIVIPKYMDQMLQMGKNNKKDGHFTSMAIHRIIYELIQSTSEKIVDQKIQDAISYIENHFNKNITVAQIADHLNMSTCYLNRMFKQVTGSSPYKYILDYRIHHAKKLLHTTKQSIESIAYCSGFNSLPHFVTIFRNRTNHSPTQFRKMKL